MRRYINHQSPKHYNYFQLQKYNSPLNLSKLYRHPLVIVCKSSTKRCLGQGNLKAPKLVFTYRTNQILSRSHLGSDLGMRVCSIWCEVVQILKQYGNWVFLTISWVYYLIEPLLEGFFYYKSIFVSQIQLIICESIDQGFKSYPKNFCTKILANPLNSTNFVLLVMTILSSKPWAT